MKPDYDLAITLTKVNGFVDIVTTAINENQFEFALDLLRTELLAYQHALTLLPHLESKAFIDFFTPWLPSRITSVQKAINSIEEKLRD